MSNINPSFNISIIKLDKNKILMNVDGLLIDFNLNIQSIIDDVINDYPEVKIEFYSNQNKSKINNLSFIIIINNTKNNYDVISPESNHINYLNQYNTEITSSLILEYNMLGLTIIGQIIKEKLLLNYNIKMFTHINSIKNINDTVDNYNTLCDKLEYFKDDTMPIVDPRAKQLMIKQINKSIYNKTPISGSIETIVYNVPKGLGNPYFNLFEASLAGNLYLIQGLKSLEFADVIKINTNALKTYKNISFINDCLKYDSNIFYGVEQGITTGDIIRFTCHFLPPLSYDNNSTSINYKTLENVYIKKNKIEYFNLHKKIRIVEALTAISIYQLIKT